MGAVWLLMCMPAHWLKFRSEQLHVKQFLYKPVSVLLCQVKCKGPRSLNICVLESEVVRVPSGRFSQQKQPFTEGRQRYCKCLPEESSPSCWLVLLYGFLVPHLCLQPCPLQTRSHLGSWPPHSDWDPADL